MTNHYNHQELAAKIAETLKPVDDDEQRKRVLEIALAKTNSNLGISLIWPNR